MQRSVVSRAVVTLVTLALAACGGSDGGTEPLVATRLAFQVQPVAAVRDTAIPAAIKVAVLDQNDDVLTSATNLITVALDQNPGSATLTGTTSVAAVNGVATFTDLKLSKTGTGYTLLANAPGIGAGSSGSFNVTLSLADVDGDGLSPNAGDCNDGLASTKPGAVDRPDGAYVDSSCDGIDGDTLQAIFMNTANTAVALCGTRAQPCNSVPIAVARAVRLGKRDVYITQGRFGGPLLLANGVSVYGGFSDSWVRNGTAQTEILSGGPNNVGGANPEWVVVYGAGLTQTTVVADLTLLGASTTTIPITGAGKSVFGVILRDVAAGVVTLERLQILSGDAGPGENGLNGTSASATAAPAGIAGDSAAEFTTTCNESSRGAGGAGATNPAATGGWTRAAVRAVRAARWTPIVASSARTTMHARACREPTRPCSRRPCSVSAAPEARALISVVSRPPVHRAAR